MDGMNDLVKRAESHLARGDYEEAIQIFQRILTSDPINPIAWYALGYAYFEAKRYNEAINAYEHAISFDPHNFMYWYALGLTYKRLKLLEKAISCFKQAISLDPPSPERWRVYGSLFRTYLRLWRWREALSVLKQMWIKLLEVTNQ